MRNPGRVLKEHTVYVARHHSMPWTGHDPGYGADMLRGHRNCHTSTRTFLTSAYRTRYFWPQAYRATPVGWKVVHDVELYPPETRRASLRVLI